MFINTNPRLKELILSLSLSFSLCFYMIDTFTKTNETAFLSLFELPHITIIRSLNTLHVHIHSPTSSFPFLQTFSLLRISPPLSTALCPMYTQAQSPLPPLASSVCFSQTTASHLLQPLLSNPSRS